MAWERQFDLCHRLLTASSLSGPLQIDVCIWDICKH